MNEQISIASVLVERDEKGRFIKGCKGREISEEEREQRRQIMKAYHTLHPENGKRLGNWVIKNKRKELKTEYDRLTTEKAYVFGVLCGDGYLFKHKCRTGYSYGLGLTSIDMEFINHFLKYIKEQYGIDGKIRFVKNGEWSRHQRYRLRCFSKLLYMELIQYGSFGIKTWHTPSEILSCDNENIIAAFLKGFVDSEGCVSRTGYQITISNTNRVGLNQIRQLLLKLGIFVSEIYASNTCLNLRITGYPNLRIFYHKVGLTISRKKTRLENYLNKQTERPLTEEESVYA